MTPHPTIAPDWRWCTPEGSREFDRLNDRLMSFREKVQWLEEAESLSLAMKLTNGRDERPRSSVTTHGPHVTRPAHDPPSGG